MQCQTYSTDEIAARIISREQKPNARHINRQWKDMDINRAVQMVENDQ